MKPRRRKDEDLNQGDEGIDNQNRTQGNEGKRGQDTERGNGELQPVGPGSGSATGGGVERERQGQREGER